MIYLLSDCPSLQYADLAGDIKVENIYNFHGLFLGSKSIKEINIYGWDFSNTNFTISNKSNGIAIFDEYVLQTVKIHISGGSRSSYLNIIKNFFHIDNDNQFITECWKYEDKYIVITLTVIPICLYIEKNNK